jgi:hypothetical protein
MTWDRRLYFPSEGRRAEDFFALKNPMASAGFEPTNLGTKGQHVIPTPPKPLQLIYILKINANFKQNSLAPDNPEFLLTDTKTFISSRFNTSERLNSQPSELFCLMKTVIRFLIFMLHDHVSCNKQTNL